MISQDLQNELGLLELDETKEKDIKVEENNEQQIMIPTIRQLFLQVIKIKKIINKKDLRNRSH